MKIVRKTLAPLSKHLIFRFLWSSMRYSTKRKNLIGVVGILSVLRASVEIVINRFNLARSENSFANEFKTIERLVSKISEHNHYLVDIGASDGITQSSTVKFLFERNYSGLLIEYNPVSFSKLAFLYDSRSDITLTKIKVTPLNVVGLMESLEVPRDFSFLNIDIDSFDLEVLRSLLGGGFLPKLISMEINEIFPPKFVFEVLYSVDHSWSGGHFFGCSIAAARKALNELGYSLVEIEFNNAFFVRNDISEGFDLDRTLDRAYAEGYAEKGERKSMFPWNHDVEFLQTATFQEGEIKIRELFKNYQGKYILQES